MAAKSVTINLRNRLVKIHASRRRAKAPDYLKEAIARQEKASPDDVKIDRRANEFLMKHVVTRSAPIRLTVEKVGQTVNVKLIQEKKPQQAPAATAAAAQKPAQQKPAAVATAAQKPSVPATAAPAKKDEKPQQKPKKENVQKPDEKKANANQQQPAK